MANDRPNIKDSLNVSVPALAETAEHLATAARVLADSAAPLLRAAPPADPVFAARAAPTISTASVPVARAAPVVADSVPLMAPLLNR